MQNDFIANVMLSDSSMKQQTCKHSKLYFMPSAIKDTDLSFKDILKESKNKNDV